MPSRPDSPARSLDADPLAIGRHDLRAILTTISGRAQLMRRRLRRGDAVDADRLLADLDAIEAASWRLADRIDHLGEERQA